MNGRRRRIIKLLQKGEVLFPLVSLAIGAYVAAASFTHQFVTGAFGGFLGLILTVLSVTLLIKNIRLELATVDTPAKGAEVEIRQRYPFIIGIGWYTGFFVASYFIGFLLSTPLFVFFFLLWNRASRVLTVALPVLLWAFIKFGLSYFDIVLFEGSLFGGMIPRFW